MSCSTRYTAVGCSCLAVSAAIHWLSPKITKPSSNSDKSTSTLTACAAFVGIGGYFLLRALGTCKIGIRRTLGISTCANNGRRLGLLERWYVAHSRAGHHTGFCVALELSKHGDIVPTLQEVQEILNRVAKRFPWLRAKVYRDGVNGVDSRERLDNPTTTMNDTNNDEPPLWGDDLYVTVNNDNGDTRYYCDLREETIAPDHSFGMAGGLAAVLEQEGRTEWHDEDPNQCLWRAVLVKYITGNNNKDNKFALVLSFHHLITDGMGAVAVLQAIVEESGGPVAVEPTKDHDSVILPPPMEDVLDTVPRLSHLLVPVLLDRFPRLSCILRPPHFQGMAHEETVAARNRTSNMVCLSVLNEKQVLMLRQVCKREQCTVNSICVAALCRALTNHVKENLEIYNGDASLLPNGGVRLKVITAVNERPDCGIQNGDLGVYLVGPQVFLQVSAECGLCEIGTAYQTKLKAARSAARMDMGLCKFIAQDWIEFSNKHADRKPNGREDSVEVSNLGRISFDKTVSQQGWKVKGLWFAQGRNVTGPAITMTMATAEGELKTVLSAVPQTFTRENLVKIGSSFQTKLRAFVDS